MNEFGKVFSSESVTKGHPDKVCDQISDAILDEFLRQDPESRVACETMLIPGKVIIAGEISSNGNVDLEKTARTVLKEVGYTKEYHGISPDDCEVEINIVPQSAEIACGISSQASYAIQEIGAGDQGIMHGYATKETSEFMPLPYILARKLVQRLDHAREEREIDYLLSDGKAQVSVLYDDKMKPCKIVNVVLSSQTLQNIHIKQIRKDLYENIIREVLPSDMLDEKTGIFINPTGRFVSGGAKADCGLTGRKIIVDTYGGWGRHGGGAFSGKDPTKVDRSGAFMARYIAKNLITSNACKRADVQIAYAIGRKEPMGVYIDTFGTGELQDEVIAKNVQDQVDLSLGAIIQKFDLKKPMYRQLAAYGPFGHKRLNLPWEKIIYYMGR